MEAVLCALFLLLAVTSSKPTPLFQLQDWPCWVFLAGLAAGLVAPVDHVVANQRYRELFVTMVSLYYIGKALARSEPDRLVLITLLCLLSSAATLYAFWYYIHHFNQSLLPRDVPLGMYGKFREEYVKNFHPTILGNYLALSPCFALSLLARGSPTLKAFGVVTLALGFLALLIPPYWRAAPYVFAITGSCALLLKQRYAALSILASIFAIILFLSFLSPTPLYRQDIRNVLVGRSGILAPHRMARIGASWSMWKDAPMVGVGFNHYWTVFDKYNALYKRFKHPNRARLTGADFEHYWRLNRPRPEESRKGHDLSVADNMYCTLLAETGLVGVTGFLLLIFAMLRRGFKGLRHAVDPDRRTCLIAALSVLAGLLVSMVGYDLFYWRTPFMLFGLVCGLISALSVTATEATASHHGIP